MNTLMTVVMFHNGQATMMRMKMNILGEPQHRFFTLHNLKLSHFLPIYKLLQSTPPSQSLKLEALLVFGELKRNGKNFSQPAFLIFQTLNSISAEKNSTVIFPLPIDLIGHLLGGDRQSYIFNYACSSILYPCESLGH